VTVTVSEALLVVSVVEVAVMVTVLLAGTAVGAVKVAVTPLAVCVGVKEPQAPALAQVTVQSTPAFAASLLTVATKGALALLTMVLFTTPCVMAMEIGAVIDIWTVATAFLGLAVATASILT
jgi:hypothetical protein